MKFPKIEMDTLLKRLEPPKGRIRMVLDTDTYNDIDDQFALVYALTSKEKLDVESIYAAPFLNKRSTSAADGMEKSYQEIIRLLNKMNISPEGLVHKGSNQFLTNYNEPIDSEAARDLIKRAMDSTEDSPLYVVSIAAITNVASAILIEPEIINKIVVVWLGGHSLNWPDTMEFNVEQDILAARVIFDSGVPVIQIPCMGVASHLLTTESELEKHLSGKNMIGDALVEIFKNFKSDHYGWAREIWDIAAIAYLINPEWVPSTIVHSPILTDQFTWSTDTRRHFMRTASFIKRNKVFKDMFEKISTL